MNVSKASNIFASILTLIVRFDVVSDQETAFAKALSDLIELTRAEQGCLRFEVAQAQANPHEFILIEQWVDQKALDQHNRTTHLQTFVSQHPLLLAQPPHVATYTELFPVRDKR